ncbi:hypothetical protein RIF29_09056 [Crotalaria pallida]|uniref:Uncharacterized protein n=1 Tax=Crotalaria pallida TaxID=3830 RepID=A0AAN9FU58_CROPI
MVSKPANLYVHVSFLYIKIFTLVLLNFIHISNSCCKNSIATSLIPPYEILSSIQTLALDGYLSLKDNEDTAKDFGNIYHFPPLVVLYQELKVAARGHGHFIQGQSQAPGSLVINMESLQGGETMKVHSGEEFPYVDVSGGELWINILHDTLKPRL